jgi:hypothetical protein
MMTAYELLCEYIQLRDMQLPWHEFQAANDKLEVDWLKTHDELPSWW